MDLDLRLKPLKNHIAVGRWLLPTDVLSWDFDVVALEPDQIGAQTLEFEVDLISATHTVLQKIFPALESV